MGFLFYKGKLYADEVIAQNTYDPESEAPISGLGVSQAIEEVEEKIPDPSTFATKDWVDLQGFQTESQVDTKINAHHDSTKQDTITDLDDIRTGSEAGSTAVQPAAIADMATKTYVDGHHKVYICIFETTTYADAIAAYNDGKTLFCKYEHDTYGDVVIPITMVRPNGMIFFGGIVANGMYSCVKLAPNGTWAIVVDLGQFTQPSDLGALAAKDTVDYTTDIINKPSIPTKTSDLTNDSGYLTLSTLPIWNGGYVDVN